jgi:hypothetical protein
VSPVALRDCVEGSVGPRATLRFPLAIRLTDASSESVADSKQDDDDIFEELERRALLGMPDEEDEVGEPMDVVRALGGEGEEPAPPAADMTLGGYIDMHNRVPAFDGVDGQPYTVDIDVETSDDAGRPFASFLVFIRWAATGAGIMDHAESGNIGSGETEDEARRAALELSLWEVKAELDAAILRKKSELED